MAAYPLNLRQRKLIEMLRPYIENELIRETSTICFRGEDVAIKGLDGKEVEEQGWINVKPSDIRKFV